MEKTREENFTLHEMEEEEEEEKGEKHEEKVLVLVEEEESFVHEPASLQSRMRHPADRPSQ
jgi:hypothetical protein